MSSGPHTLTKMRTPWAIGRRVVNWRARPLASRPDQHGHGNHPPAHGDHLDRRIIGRDEPFAKGVDDAHAEHAQFHKADTRQISIAVGRHAIPI
jgi:hypothetical protein